MEATEVTVPARAAVEQLVACGVTHVVWLPDSEANFMYQVLSGDQELKLVQVCREAETMAIAVGIMVGGKQPVCLIQNTGFMESGDSLRGWAMQMEVPVVLMVGYRGYTRHGVNKDTAATYTERFLNAFNINYYLVEEDADAERISIAFAEAKKTKRPVAVLVADEYHGFN